jgi:peptide subunit release factor 1 (eRF1)
LKTIKLTDNGLYLFVGINEYDKEYVKCLEPLIMNEHFIYNCGSKFETSILEMEIKKNNNIYYFILINGYETYIYKYDGTFRIIERINGNLIKRQKKGGQSSVRFSRLAEESRHIYITRIIDKINILCKNGKETWIFGSKELKNDLLNSKMLLIKLLTNDRFNVINDNFINENKKELENIMLKHDDINEKIIKEVCELIDKNPDMLVFGDEINEDNCEIIITINNNKLNKKTICVSEQSKYYSIVKLYQQIGKKFFTFKE